MFKSSLLVGSSFVALIAVTACITSRGGPHEQCRASPTATGGCDDGLTCQNDSCEPLHSHGLLESCTTNEVCADGLLCNGAYGHCETPGTRKPGEGCSQNLNCLNLHTCFFGTCSGDPVPLPDGAAPPDGAGGDAAAEASADAGTD